VNVQLHPAARIDLDSAADWYQVQAGQPIAADFIEAYAQAVDLIGEYPDIGRLGSHCTRAISLRRFPFSLIYQASKQQVVILAVAHWRRRPMFWVKRL
jgi:toxin ParE1/3/4